jgi:hypothetical protein
MRSSERLGRAGTDEAAPATLQVSLVVFVVMGALLGGELVCIGQGDVGDVEYDFAGCDDGSYAMVDAACTCGVITCDNCCAVVTAVDDLMH